MNDELENEDCFGDFEEGHEECLKCEQIGSCKSEQTKKTKENFKEPISYNWIFYISILLTMYWEYSNNIIGSGVDISFELGRFCGGTLFPVMIGLAIGINAINKKRSKTDK